MIKELRNEVTAMDGQLYDRWNRPLVECANPACGRLVKQGTLYCCGGCGRAHEMKAEAHEGGDMFSHADSCNELHAERQAAIRPESL